MNVTHEVAINGVPVKITVDHEHARSGAESLNVQVFEGGSLLSSERQIVHPTAHFVTDDGMVDTAEPCNCGPNAACSNCPRPDVREATKREAALAAVYEAIERQASYSHIDNPGALSGLAALVDALVSASVTEARA